MLLSVILEFLFPEEPATPEKAPEKGTPPQLDWLSKRVGSQQRQRRGQKDEIMEGGRGTGEKRVLF